MARFDIRVDDLKQRDARPVSEAVILLKTFISDESIIYDLDLAMTEAVSNVTCHAYSEQETCFLGISLETTPGKLVRITVMDKGKCWDQSDISSELPQAWSEGGRGIPLMTRLCDRVEFTRKDDTNIVTLTKHIPPDAWRE